jgi:hypothetical protein
MMPDDLQELLSAFNDQGVKYLIVGGYAFGVHAEPRATKDLDIFIRSDEENSKAVFRALAQYFVSKFLAHKVLRYWTNALLAVETQVAHAAQVKKRPLARINQSKQDVLACAAASHDTGAFHI